MSLYVTIINNNYQFQTKTEAQQTKIRKKNQYNAGIDKRTRTLTTLSPSTKHLNRLSQFQHMLHSRPDTTNTYRGNGHLVNYMNQGTQNRRHTYHTVLFRSSNIEHDLCSFHHRGSPRPSDWFYSTDLCEYSSNIFHTSNITASNLEISPHARGTLFEDNLLLSIMIEENTIQAALSSIEIFNGRKGKFKAWTEPNENAAQISGQN